MFENQKLSNTARSLTLRSITLLGVEFLNFEFEYHCKNEFLSKTIIAYLSGAQIGKIREKIEVENLLTLTL